MERKVKSALVLSIVAIGVASGSLSLGVLAFLLDETEDTQARGKINEHSTTLQQHSDNMNALTKEIEGVDALLKRVEALETAIPDCSVQEEANKALAETNKLLEEQKQALEAEVNELKAKLSPPEPRPGVIGYQFMD